MPICSLFDAPEVLERPTDMLQKEILDHLNEQSVISLDSLVSFLPQYGWNQIFEAVDGLARRRLIVLRRHGFEYTLFSLHYAA
jgi:hypothetical protein